MLQRIPKESNGLRFGAHALQNSILICKIQDLDKYYGVCLNEGMRDKFEIENFRLPERLRDRFHEEVERLQTTKSQFVRDAIEERIKKLNEKIFLVVEGTHEEEKRVTLSELITYYLDSVFVALQNNREHMRNILYLLLDTWRDVKRSEIRRKKGKGKKKSFKTKLTK